MRTWFALLEIPRWTESDGFRRLLRVFEQVLPLQQPSDLLQRTIVHFLIGPTAQAGFLNPLMVESLY